MPLSRRTQPACTHAPTALIPREVRMAAPWLPAALTALCAAALLAACSRPEPPEKERRPEPQATAPARHTELRDAIQAPQDKARAVEGAVDEAAKAQREAIEAAGG